MKNIKINKHMKAKESAKIFLGGGKLNQMNFNA